MDLKLITNTISLTLLFFICINGLNVVNCNDNVIQCSASKNEKWNTIKNKCVTCWDCKPGHFRNLTEKYTGRHGDHGDEQCLPCRPCPDGTFSEDGRGECSRCRMNCTRMFREYDATCSRTQDAKCGSCLTNYVDTYGHTLLPCSPKKDFRSFNSKDKGASTSITEPVAEKFQTAKGPKVSNSGMIAAVVVGALTVVTAIFAVLMFVFRRQRAGRRHIIPRNQDSYSFVNIEEDLETDAVREDTAPKVHSPLVRPELRTETQPEARPEMPAPISSLSQLNGIDQVRFPDGSVVSIVFRFDFCNCKNELTCNCNPDTFQNIQLEKSDEYVTTTASEICHDFLQLFQKLGLKPPTLYQENDSRNRDPEKITQKELVIRLLNIWIERQPTPSTLRQLSVALCEAKFHKINQNLLNLYRRKMRI